MGWMNFLPLVCCSVQPPPCLSVWEGQGRVVIRVMSTRLHTPLTGQPTTGGINHPVQHYKSQHRQSYQHSPSTSGDLRALRRNKGWRIFLCFRSDGLISVMTTLSQAMRGDWTGVGQTQCRPSDSRPTSHWIVNIQAFNSSSSRFRNKLRNMIKMWLVTAVGGQTDYFFQCFRHIFLVFS